MPSPSVQRALELAENKTAENKLGLVYNGKTLESGQFVPRAEAQQPPHLTYATGGPYLVIAIDLDAPFPSFPVLGPILHYIRPGFTNSGTGTLNAGSSSVIADWVAPRPPPGSGPHRYVIILYDQPADFDEKKFLPKDNKPLPLSSRVRWDLGKFENEAKLGNPIAASYFTSN